MLVLSRKPGESVIVRDGDGKFVCRVFLCEINRIGHQARIGFEADRSVSINRWEVDQELYGGKTNE